jgi:hypothetical protein
MDYLQKIRRLEDKAPKTKTDWLTAWRELAPVTYGITKDDPRFESVMRWLNICDTAFSTGSWTAFIEGAERVKQIAQGNRQAGGEFAGGQFP